LQNFYSKDDKSIIGDRKLTEIDDFDPALIAQANQSVNNMGYDDLKDLLHDYIEDQYFIPKDWRCWREICI
jgi:hypothetical protein